jgi:phage baseplate assembly protein W
VYVAGWIFLCRAEDLAVMRIHWKVQSHIEHAAKPWDPAVRVASVSLRRSFEGWKYKSCHRASLINSN